MVELGGLIVVSHYQGGDWLYIALGVGGADCNVKNYEANYTIRGYGGWL